MPLPSQRTYLGETQECHHPSVCLILPPLSVSKEEERTKKTLPPTLSSLPLPTSRSCSFSSLPSPFPPLSSSFPSPPPPHLSPHQLSLLSVSLSSVSPCTLYPFLPSQFLALLSPQASFVSLPLPLNHKGSCDITPSVVVVGYGVLPLLPPTAFSGPECVYAEVHTLGSLASSALG